MKSPTIRRIVESGGELLLAAGMIAVLAFGLLAALMVIFPQGTRLIDLYGNATPTGGNATALDQEREGVAIPILARVTETRRTVRDRAASALVWSDSTNGTPIRNRHAVQTLKRSGATISFEDGGEMILGEDSLVVIKRASGRRGLRERKTSLVVLGGRVQGSFQARGEQAVDIVTPSGTATLNPESDSPVEVAVTVNADDSSTISLLRGSADVTAGDKTLRIDSDHSATIDGSGFVGGPVSLPSAPVLLSPTDGAVLEFGNVPPNVRFRWSEVPSDCQSVLTISRDPGLGDTMYEGAHLDRDFTHGNLAEGTYYWRVHAMCGRIEGPHSRTSEVKLVRDVTPPELRVTLPATVEGAASLMVQGETEPGAAVTVDRHAVVVDGNGRFEQLIDLAAGMNVVVIEAVDSAGNNTYHSQYVTAKTRQD